MTQSPAHPTVGHHAEHPPGVAHHFESAEQQYISAKLGMWVFLATEILMFGGLFCAYAVYRANRPEVFLYAHHFLDMGLGAINTVVLLTSSLTMAWGVRAAQKGQKGLLVAMLSLTLLGGVGFMVIKAMEYAAKYEYKWVGPRNMFFTGSTPLNLPGQQHRMEEYYDKYHPSDGHPAGHASTAAALQPGDAPAGPGHTPAPGAAADPAADAPAPEHSQIQRAPSGPAGLTALERSRHDPAHRPLQFSDLSPSDKGHVYHFFQIYFMMTGLHGIHVLVGMGLIAWLLVRALGGSFGPGNFTAVDLVGLYWHLVDLIWIFLFPLLYLIH